MAKRSLQASPTGIPQAKRAFALLGWTQENLAAEVNLKTRQPIWRFFTGQPVDRQVFMEICSVLDLDWREIADSPPVEFAEPGSRLDPAAISLDDLVETVRSQRREALEKKCGILQLLDIGRPVNLDDVYIDVNILEEIASQRWQSIEDLQSLAPSEFNRAGLGLIEEKQLSGMQAVETYAKLRVLGRPGTGKTTFLQYLAVQCNRGTFAADRVPVFLSLRDFAEYSRKIKSFDLFDYICQILGDCGEEDAANLSRLMGAGRLLLLLDGMDEVLNQDSTAVIREIRKFSEKYYQTQLVVTCRTALQKMQLRGFTDVEIAPFSQAQIAAFSKKWFTTLDGTTPQLGRVKANRFMEKLEQPENWQLRQLVVTPLFLHVACWIFQGEYQFPAKRTDFYKQGLDLLLSKWDKSRGIERDEIYHGFLLPQKIRLLSQLAAATFEKGEYFFEQRVVEQYIEDYLGNLPGVDPEPEELQVEGEAVLRAIETQHGLLTERARGIFSFSYLAFHEYFTARKIVASHNLRGLEKALEGLVNHISDPHWREVFLLTVAMLRSADALVQLMKQHIDVLLAQDPYLQEFLTWANDKSQTVPAQPKIATSRAFYLALAQSPRTAADFALASTLDQGMFLDAALDHLLIECAMEQSQDFACAHACGEAINNILVMVLDAGFYKALQQLKDQLPGVDETQGGSQRWWDEHYQNWTESLKQTVDTHRSVNKNWEFSADQQEILQSYYYANQLLIDCLNSKCEVTVAIRQEIEATLLLPQKELEAREWKGT